MEKACTFAAIARREQELQLRYAGLWFGLWPHRIQCGTKFVHHTRPPLERRHPDHIIVLEAFKDEPSLWHRPLLAAAAPVARRALGAAAAPPGCRCPLLALAGGALLVYPQTIWFATLSP
jgi:hypothetical protein